VPSLASVFFEDLAIPQLDSSAPVECNFVAMTLFVPSVPGPACRGCCYRAGSGNSSKYVPRSSVIPRASSSIEDRISSPDETAEPATNIPDSLPSNFSDGLGADHVPDSAPESEATEAPKAAFSGSLKGMLLLNLGALLFGSNQVVIKTAEEVLSPFALDALRFGAAAICFLPFLPRALKQEGIILPAAELGLWLTGLLSYLTYLRFHRLANPRGGRAPQLVSQSIEMDRMHVR
jgi:hypothetical protein